MGSRISLLCGVNQATENLAQESYLSGDIESFNVAVQSGAQLKDIEKMDKSFLEKIAQHPEISYPKKVVEFAGKTGDSELTREIFRNGLKHNKTDVNTLKMAIMLDDAQTVANILDIKPWLSNQQVRVNTSEGLIPCRIITMPKDLKKASKADIHLWKEVYGTGQFMLEEHPISATVKPLDIALYKATNAESAQYVRERL